MKQTRSFAYDFDVAANATGFAAIALACSNAWEKIKGLFGGSSHGHSGIHGTGAIHVEISSTVEFNAEEAELAARINQESFDNLSKNMGSLIDASKQYCEYLRDESDKFIDWFYKETDKMSELDEINSEKSMARCEEREAKREATKKAAKAKED